MLEPSAKDCAHPWPRSGPEHDHLVAALSDGALHLAGLIPWSSNYTFLGDVTAGDRTIRVVYKPIRGEQPLWDFPRNTLAKREAAAYTVCRALGWDFVPPTVLRRGPHGLGSVQLFADVDQDAHFFTFRDDPAYRRSLQALCLFDIVSNNADRKGGHCLAAGDGCLIAIDHGLCFHVEDKLRTVIWDFAGEAIPADLAADVARLAQSLAEPESASVAALGHLLDRGEIARTRRRAEQLLADGVFPLPPQDRRPYPWPLV